MTTIKQMLAIFNKKQKMRLVGITIIIFFGGIAELLGVSSIMPFINMILVPDEMMSNKYVVMFCNIFNVNDFNTVMVALTLGIILLYIAKNVYMVFMNYLQYHFTYFGLRDLSCRLMNSYMAQSYPFHVEHNSAELIRNVNTDTNMFYSTVLNFLQLISEGVVCVLLVGYLMYEDAVIALVVAGSMGVFVFGFMRMFRREFKKMGAEYRIYNEQQLRCMNQSFGGIKEIKIAEKEGFFEKNYHKISTDLARNQVRNGLFNAMPKPVMEVLCIGSILAIVAVKVMSNSADTAHFISVLAVFAVAAFRLLPSINKVSGHIGVIIYDKAAVEAVYNQLNAIKDVKVEQKADEASKFAFEKEIKMDNVTFRYDGGEKDVLNNVTLEVPKNKSVAFIGPSGAGKTTTVDIILGVLSPNKGKILVDGIDVSEHMHAWHDKIGYIPQTIYLMDDTIRNNIAFGVNPEDINDEDVWKALEEAQLKDFVEKMENGLDTVIGELGVRLSGGQRQRIGIARALYRKPEVLVLDEATSALDSETEKAVMEAIDELQGKMTLLIIAHRLTTIKNCDIVYEIKDASVTKTEKNK